MTIRFTLSAKAQFMAALEYIHRDNSPVARRFRRRAEVLLRRLVKLPASGRRVPEFPGLPFRELLVGSYRFFYRVKGKDIWVAAVWHGAQLPEKPSDGKAV